MHVAFLLGLAKSLKGCALSPSSVHILTSTITRLPLIHDCSHHEECHCHASRRPKAANFDVRPSSFFQHHDQLPSPEEVRSRARAQYSAGTYWGWRTGGVKERYNRRPTPAVFEEMSLFVKWGSEIKVIEGQTLYALRHSCGDSVPVPEIYGWRTDGHETFLYMEAISRTTLEDVWSGMEEDDRLRICSELRTILHNLRQLKQSPEDKFIGSITRGNYYERALFFESQSETGPFTSVKDFHDWYTLQYKRKMPDPETVPEPYRKELPDDSEIVFTHGDLHPSNIIISSAPPRVAAVIDWEQSAWLPGYWEHCKAHGTHNKLSGWYVKYLPLILDGLPGDERIRDAWWYYTDPVGF
ncbi:kinase-like protein [Westerdykella ornata]|uniref:Kinase-like protein n=1 Tax=Westerdykella ornata TaxID=318751 RepID=A0A6A6JWK7_WESOR|nr:kinase-like protein [Westerdykella ornata]KAF2280463.1 kinase-like protein [Westerdykella ornata]